MKWTDDLIRREIIGVINTLRIERMPTAEELRTLGRGDLHNKISKTKTYRGWASELGLSLKSSCTTRGQKAESDILERLVSMGYTVEQMTTKHPYDLLVNETVKVDCKYARPFSFNGSRGHAFGLSKRNPTCDIYVCIAADEKDIVERVFVIPSHHLKIVTLSVGGKSEYDKYIDRWDYIDVYSAFHSQIS